MPGVHDLGLFIASGILLILTPGQDTLYIIGRSIAQGRRAGVLSALGIQAGCIAHTMAAAFGLAAVLAASPHAYLALTYFGAAYLTFMGLQLLTRQAIEVENAERNEQQNAWRVFYAGLITNLLNPKVALFYLAFLPQFIEPDAPSTVLAFLFLGGIFIGTNTVWCLALAWGAARAVRDSRRNIRTGLLLKRASGLLFIGLGLKLALIR
jgi:threonine/homoserine/homoserine lactone efflux protein